MPAAFPHLANAGFIMPNGAKLSASTLSGSTFNAASTGTRRTRSWVASSSGPNAAYLNSLETLRNRSRGAVRNDPWASRAVEQLVSDLVGSYIRPQWELDNPDLRKQIQNLWRDSVDDMDADGCLSFYGMQALATRSALEGAECFIRFRPRRPEDGLAVPMQVQLLESEHVPVEWTTMLPNGNRVVAGVEFNAVGKRVAFHMHRTHPGDVTHLVSTDYGKLAAVPADSVAHLFHVLRPGQVRGLPHFTQSLLRLYGLDKYDDAVMFRQELANLWAVFITSPSDTDGENDPFTGEELDSTEDIPETALEPGTMQALEPGEDIKFPTPPDAGNNYPAFTRQQLMAIAAGFGLPYEMLSGDYKDVNDRVMRVILTDYRRRIRQLQAHMIVQQMCRKVVSWWLDMAVLSGALNIPDYAENRRAYHRVKWIAEGWDYIHPEQDVNATLKAIGGGLESRTNAVAKRGGDAERIDQENAEDRKREKDAGLEYDFTTAAAGANSKGKPGDKGDKDSTEADAEEAAIRKALLQEFGSEAEAA